MMKNLGIAGMVLAAVSIGYLLNTPIPPDLAEPLYFRLFVAGLKATDILTALTMSLLPSDPNLHVRAMRSIIEIGLPDPSQQAFGSNLTTRYTNFDGIRVLVYEPVYRPDSPIPALVYFHGGGYALGSTKLHGYLTRHLAERLNIVLVSVDYRLAPEHPLPAGPDDGVVATRYLLQHADEFGIDPHRVIVAGDSAGGHLATVVTHRIHDDSSLPDLKLQVLLYPWLQALHFHTPSYQLYHHTFGELGLSRSKVVGFVAYNIIQRLDADFERKVMRNMHMSPEFKRSAQFQRVFDHNIIHEKLANVSLNQDITDLDSSYTSYPFDSLSDSIPKATFLSSLSLSPSTLLSSVIPLPTDYQTPLLSYEPLDAFEPGNETFWAEIQHHFLEGMSPLLREDMTGLPKAFIATADQDVLRDDGIFYSHALELGGVEVDWINYRGAWHGMADLGIRRGLPIGIKMVEDAIAFIQDNI
ncbi:carboxylesterase NlhH-like [Lytechinus variegatus]|uniref:carboxylesterase NlhH-like n=1 Tax=Lytechinus variegatus TaxID=7654 RepID=UPI001BB2BE63|nr:carboxylesterase NlhH-like [Lytechinus variegatus]